MKTIMPIDECKSNEDQAILLDKPQDEIVKLKNKNLKLEKINKYVKEGYTDLHHFYGEYTLLLSCSSLTKIRVYENGDVWKTNNAGEYERSSEGCQK